MNAAKRQKHIHRPSESLEVWVSHGSTATPEFRRLTVPFCLHSVAAIFHRVLTQQMVHSGAAVVDREHQEE